MNQMPFLSTTSTNELRQMGVYYPPARIKELRNQGYLIDTFFRDETDSTSLIHRVGVYVLHENAVSQKRNQTSTEEV